MRNRFISALVLASLSAAALPAQQSSTAGSATSRAKQLLGSAADTAVTSAASMLADTLLVANGGMVPATMTAEGAPTCEAGLIAIPAEYVTGGTATPAQSMPGVPTPGSALVGMAKKKLAGDDGDTNTTATAPSSGYLCGTPEQVSAAMRSAQSGSAGGAPSMTSGIASALGSTRKGAMVGGAVAAAPLAGKAARKLGGMFGRGAQTAESMTKDLGKGRLTVKKLEFVEGSDELAEGFENHIAMLAEALLGLEGRFELRVPAESDASEPNVSLAERRVQRVFTHLLVAGVPAERLTTAAGTSTAKRNEARLEVAAVPTEGTP